MGIGAGVAAHDYPNAKRSMCIGAVGFCCKLFLQTLKAHFAVEEKKKKKEKEKGGKEKMNRVKRE